MMIEKLENELSKIKEEHKHATGSKRYGLSKKIFELSKKIEEMKQIETQSKIDKSDKNGEEKNSGTEVYKRTAKKSDKSTEKVQTE